jgi:hypothetical protein
MQIEASDARRVSYGMVRKTVLALMAAYLKALLPSVGLCSTVVRSFERDNTREEDKATGKTARTERRTHLNLAVLHLRSSVNLGSEKKQIE